MMEHVAAEAGRQTFRILLTVVAIVAVCAGLVGYLFGRFA